jgi:ketosteroid isomerase-like protein
MQLKVIVALVVTLAAASPATLAQVPSAAVEVRSPAAGEAANAVDAFHNALKRNDVPGALALLADDVMIYEGGRVERSKAEYASHHAPADAAYSAAVPSTLQKRLAIAEGNIAWITSESRATGRYKDKPVDQLTVETMILRKEQDGWRIVHVHWSSRPAPK